jgi:pimeloyl-ACP methyl ester carboxylesterase
MALTEEGIIKVPGLLSRWVRLASGAKAHYMTAGETGPAVVLLHGGLPGSSGTAGWRFMAPFLGANGFRVYCPDQPGFGLSDIREEYRPQGVHSHVDFVHEFATALCLDRFHLAGNSMGCINTVNYTVAHPERVEKFALIAGDVGNAVPVEQRPKPSLPMTQWDGTRQGMRSLMEAIIHANEVITDDLIEMRFRAATAQKESHAQFWPGLLQFLGILPWQDTNVAARLSTKGRITELDIPAIYLYGRQDVLTPVEWGYIQEQHLPRIQFFYPDETGHQGQTDQPELFNQVFLEFFRDGKVSKETALRAGVSERRPTISSLVDA